MKHLKLFEGYLDKYYEEVEYDDLVGWLRNTERVTLTREWYDKISNLFGPEWEREPYGYLNINLWSLDFRKPTNRGVWHVIIGMDYDEWFYVVIRYSGKPISNECFKCDQFEGLKRLLTDRKII